MPASDLHDCLSEWQHYYNWERPHGSLGGTTPIEKVNELASHLLLGQDVEALYDSTKERIQEHNYQAD